MYTHVTHVYIGVTRLQDLKNQIDATVTAIAKAEREYDLNSAAVLKYGTLPDLQKQLKAEEEVGILPPLCCHPYTCLYTTLQYLMHYVILY